MTAIATIEVTCTNCGGTDWPTLIVALVALAVALASLVIAIRAFRIQSREHEEFLARPEIEFMPMTTPEAGLDGITRLNGRSVIARVNLGFRNVGGRPADNVSVNVLLQRDHPFMLTHEGGAEIHRGDPAETDEHLPGSDGRPSVPAHWLGRDVGQVRLNEFVPVWLAIPMELPADGSPVELRMRLRVIGARIPDGRVDFDYVARFAAADQD